MDTYVQLEDIAEQLTCDLAGRQFQRIDPRPKEVLRYAKNETKLLFQVGLRQMPDDEPEYNKVSLVMNFNVPVGVTVLQGERIIPQGMLRELFGKVESYGIQGVPKLVHERMAIVYGVDFLKSDTTQQLMSGTLRETIDYFCNIITHNCQMIENTRTLK